MLLPRALTSEEKSVVVSLREFAKRLVKIHRIDEPTATRLAYYKLVNQVAQKTAHKLPFRDEALERFKDVAVPESCVAEIAENIELLDILYETVIEEGYRKKKGQFLTPPRVAEFMASWGMLGEVRSVLDPAVGTGIFLDKVSKLLRENSEWELYGIDIDPVLLNATSLRLKLLGTPIDRVTLLQEDFLKIDPPQKQFDLVICNPPYLKFHHFDRRLNIHFIEQRFGLKLSRLTNLYSLFFIQAASFVADGGKMVFITPSEFFYTGYGEELKKFLVENLTIEAFVLIDFSRTVFDGVLTTAVITLLRKTPPTNQHKVKFIRVLEWPEDNQVLVKAVTGGARDDRYYNMHQVAQGELNPSEKWLVHFGENPYSSVIQKLVPLSKIAQVNRGIATGHNKFFTLNEHEVARWKIEDRFLRPVISKAIHCQGYDFTPQDYEKLRKKGEKVFLLYVSEEPSENLRLYIKQGEKMGVHRRYLTKHRKPWYSMEKGEVAPILATVFSRDRMRFILNNTNCLNLTAFHGIYPNFRNRTLLKAFLAYLNSNLCREVQTIMRREYGGGLHKFEPRDLEKLPVLDVTALSTEDVERLATLFDELCASARSSVTDEEKVKYLIDKELRRILRV